MPSASVTSDRARDQTETPYQFAGKGGEGAGSCEVPRGILFHNYTIGDDGKVVGANCIIPTGQNLANIEADMRALVPQILDQGQDKVQMMMEMLVRAYDSCISCSTHFLNGAICVKKDPGRTAESVVGHPSFVECHEIHSDFGSGQPVAGR